MRDPHRRCAQPRSRSDELAELSDRALLDRMRVGDDAAFGALYCRHADAVRAFAARTSAGSEGADDLTAEAFFRVLQTVRNGSGPVEYVRAYLITVTRRVAAEWSARRFDVPVSDEELVRRSEPGLDGAARRVERSLIATAFISLPERWRTVLWRVEVEGERPAVVAHYFGLSANATAALARRARDGLRAAYLQAHLSTSGGHGACRSITQKLGAYTAGGLRGSEMRRVDAHLAECPACRSLHAELSEVCSGLRAHAGLLLAPVAAAGLASAGTVSSGGAGTSLAAGAKIGKLAAFAARVKLGLTAASATAIGVLGVGAGLLLSDARPPLDQGLDGNHGNVIAVSPESTSSGPSSTRLSARGSPHQVSTSTSGEQQQDVSSQAHHGSNVRAAHPADQPAGTGGRQNRSSPATWGLSTMSSSSTVTATDAESTDTEPTDTEPSAGPTPLRDTGSTPPDPSHTERPPRSYPSEPSGPTGPSTSEPSPSSIPVAAE